MIWPPHVINRRSLAGLRVLRFETTPVHGESCLWTLQLRTAPAPVGLLIADDGGLAASAAAGSSATSVRATETAAPGAAAAGVVAGAAAGAGGELMMVSPSLAARLRQEVDGGLTTDFFYDKFRARAEGTRRWLEAQLRGLKASGYTVGAYGAAAKGMVLLHFILSGGGGGGAGVGGGGGGGGDSGGVDLIEFVLDDASLKQSTFCPGTRVPVHRTDFLANLSSSGGGGSGGISGSRHGGGAGGRGKGSGASSTLGSAAAGGADGTPKIAIVVLAWNFWEEIQTKLQRLVRGAAAKHGKSPWSHAPRLAQQTLADLPSS